MVQSGMIPDYVSPTPSVKIILDKLFPGNNHYQVPIDYYVQAWALAWTGTGIEEPFTTEEVELATDVVRFYGAQTSDWVKALYALEAHESKGTGHLNAECVRAYYQGLGVRRDGLNEAFVTNRDEWMLNKHIRFKTVILDNVLAKIKYRTL